MVAPTVECGKWFERRVAGETSRGDARLGGKRTVTQGLKPRFAASGYIGAEAPTPEEGRPTSKAAASRRTPKRRLTGDPAVEDGALGRGDAFVEADAHAQARADINDSGEEVEFFAFVGKLDADDGARRRGIECVDIAAGAADVAGAGGKASAGIHLSDFSNQNQRHAVSAATVLHGTWHHGSPVLCLERSAKSKIRGLTRERRDDPYFIFEREEGEDKKECEERSETGTGRIATNEDGRIRERRLINDGIERVADAALMIAGVVLAIVVAEKREASGSGVNGGSGGRFVLRGSAEIVCADDDHAEAVAVVLAAGEVGIEQAGGVSGNFCALAEFGERFGEAGVGLAVGFNGGGDGFEVGERALLIAADGGAVPLDLEGGEIEEEHADGEDLPGGIFADQAHENVVRIAALWIAGIGDVANVDGQEGEVVAQVCAAELEFGGAVRSHATHGRTARRAGGERRSAGAAEKDEAFHQFNPGRGSEAGEGFEIASGEKFFKLSFVVSASGSEKVAEGGGGSVGSGG